MQVGREVSVNELMLTLEIGANEIRDLIDELRTEYEIKNRGINIIKVNDKYQMCSNKDYYEYIYPIIDKRNKPKLSNAALETLAIIAYNPRISRAEIESIRGVNSDGTIYKLLDYSLIEEDGKLDLPGRPTAYKTTTNFLKMFGYTSLDDLPELPRYKLDENKQIVIDEILEENNEKQIVNEVGEIPERVEESEAESNIN